MFISLDQIILLMKTFFTYSIIFLVICSCEQDVKENTTSQKAIPELLIVDSLIVDRLTEFTLVDVNENRSTYLLYDWKTSEFMNVSRSGEILAIASLTGDGKNSYKDGIFYGAKYWGEDWILIQTYSGLYRYDLNFQLIEKLNHSYQLVTRRVGGSRAFDIFGKYLYTFSIEEVDAAEVYKNEDFSISYPFLTIRDAQSLDILKSEFIPKTSAMAEKPGKYISLDPIVQLKKDRLFVLFPNSPEMYEYDFPSLNLRNSWDLNPGKSFKLARPVVGEEGVKGFYNSLAAEEYQYFAFSNDYLLTIYVGAAPQEEVDALPQDVVGGQEFNEIIDKYKDHNYYQIFKEEEKLWEGTWDINLQVVRNLIFSNAKVGEDPEAVEKDFQTLYFYELK